VAIADCGALSDVGDVAALPAPPKLPARLFRIAAERVDKVLARPVTPPVFSAPQENAELVEFSDSVDCVLSDFDGDMRPVVPL
jgi:hypothetical protein